MSKQVKKLSNAEENQLQIDAMNKWSRENTDASLRERNMAANTISKLFSARREEQDQRIKYGDLVPLAEVVRIRDGTIKALDDVLSPGEQAELQRYSAGIPKNYIQELNDKIHDVMVGLYVYTEG